MAKTMAGNTVCIRLPVEVKAQVEAMASEAGVGVSDIMRQALFAFMGGDPQFAHTRQQAYTMARKLVETLSQELPDSLDEAIARGLIEL